MLRKPIFSVEDIRDEPDSVNFSWFRVNIFDDWTSVILLNFFNKVDLLITNNVYQYCTDYTIKFISLLLIFVIIVHFNQQSIQPLKIFFQYFDSLRVLTELTQPTHLCIQHLGRRILECLIYLGNDWLSIDSTCIQREVFSSQISYFLVFLSSTDRHLEFC